MDRRGGLLPCPLCRSKDVSWWNHGQFDSQTDACCDECGCSASVEIWNDRPLEIQAGAETVSFHVNKIKKAT